MLGGLIKLTKDKFGYPIIMVRKSGGFGYELSSDPNNDNFFDSPVKMNKNGDGSWSFANYDSIRPEGHRIPYNGQIGCDMNQTDAEAKGYGYKKATDLRDIEFKFAVKVTAGGSGLWDSDITIQGPTGRHTNPQPCCEGCAYGISVSYGASPMQFRWSKEQAHSDYTFLDGFTHPSFNFQLKGAGKYVGFGLIRYNVPQNNDQDGVKLDFIGNPDPDADPTNWIVIAHMEDFGGSWGKSDASKICNARKKKQQLNWAMPKAFRIKMTDTKLRLQLKNLSLWEIDGTKATGGDDQGQGGGGLPSVSFGFGELQVRRDINTEGTSACVAGATSTAVFDQENQNGDTDLDGANFSAGETCLSTTSKLFNLMIKSGKVYLLKHGSGANINLKIRKGTDNSIARSITTINASSINTTETEISFTDSGNTYRMKVNDYFSIEQVGGDSTNHISVMRDDASTYDGNNSKRFWAKPTYEIHSGDIKLILDGVI